MKARYPNNNMGGEELIETGKWTDAERGLIEFNLTGVLPIGATISSAILSLYCYFTSSAYIQTFNRVKIDWGEGNKTGPDGAAAGAGESTWNAAKHGSVSWSTAGCAGSADIKSVATGTFIVAVNSWNNIDVTADVEYWLAGGSNHGWRIISSYDTGLLNYKYTRFVSSEGAGSTPVSGAAALRPKLILTYVPYPAPAVSSISPAFGPTTGGQRVRIVGTGFGVGQGNIDNITIGGAKCTDVSLQSSTLVSGDTPAGSTGLPKGVRVENPDGQNDTLPSAYTYIASQDENEMVELDDAVSVYSTGATVCWSKYAGVNTFISYAVYVDDVIHTTITDIDTLCYDITGLATGIEHKVYIILTTDAGASSSNVITIILVNGAPNITSSTPTSPLTCDPGEGFYFAITATDPDGDPITYQWYEDSKEQAEETTTNFRWEANDTHKGKTAFIGVKVSDNQGNDTWQRWRVYVTPPHRNREEKYGKAPPTRRMSNRLGGWTGIRKSN